MYRPYESDSGSESGSGSGYESASASDSGQSRIRAADAWRNQLREAFVAGPSIPGPTAEIGHDLTYNQTSLAFESTRPVQVLTVDSMDRDPLVYPNPLSFKLKLPQVYKNVARLDIVQIKMMSGLYTLTAAKGNTTLSLYDSIGALVSVTIPDGTYSATVLASTLTKALKAATTTQTYTVTYTAPTGRFSITSTAKFRLPFASNLSTPANSAWGLGWNLGFGGAPLDLSAATTQTATYMPRLTTDYIYLRLNDTENMNTVDSTGPEDLAVSLNSTGQTAQYFGKLLLNDFGSYAQTFLEAPKIFKPVLSRLDRLSFDWVDRLGNPITGQDALSCEWHMTIRIIQLKDAQTDSSAIIRAPV